jgi:hypothetical protein
MRSCADVATRPVVALRNHDTVYLTRTFGELMLRRDCNRYLVFTAIQFFCTQRLFDDMSLGRSWFEDTWPIGLPSTSSINPT